MAQAISKKEAIKIAKNYKEVNVTPIDSIALITDSNNIKVWVITQKVNVEKEYKRIRKAGMAGMNFICKNRIKINANTGDMISKERIRVGSIHIRGKW